MPEAISNTSPLLYLYRIQALDWLPQLFDDVWIPNAVVLELEAGQKQSYDVPRPKRYPWLKVVEPGVTSLDWQALDLGPGELAAMSLALEHPAKIVLLDDMLARQAAQNAELRVWGTLKILLEAKSQGLTTTIKPLVYRLDNAGMWLSAEIVQRVLALADET